jgi:hypothetical protein
VAEAGDPFFPLSCLLRLDRHGGGVRAGRGGVGIITHC